MIVNMHNAYIKHMTDRLVQTIREVIFRKWKVEGEAVTYLETRRSCTLLYFDVFPSFTVFTLVNAANILSLWPVGYSFSWLLCTLDMILVALKASLFSDL